MNQDFTAPCCPRGTCSPARASRWPSPTASHQPGQPAGQPDRRAAASSTTTTPPPKPGRCAGRRAGAEAPTRGCTPRTMAGDARFEKDLGHVWHLQRADPQGRELHLLHVGDSRIYRLHPRRWSSSPKTTGAPVVGPVVWPRWATGPHVEIDYRCWGGRDGRPLPAGHRRRRSSDAAAAALDASPPPSVTWTPPRRMVSQPAWATGRRHPTLQLLRIDAARNNDCYV